MGNVLKITLKSSPRKVTLTTGRKTPISSLEVVWDDPDTTDSDKNTFVDTNDTEILTFIDNTVLLLSANATAAVNKIIGGSGTLTDLEKYWMTDQTF